MIFEKSFERMSCEELRYAMLSLDALYRQTGHTELNEWADRAANILAQRFLSEPNPYEVSEDKRNV